MSNLNLYKTDEEKVREGKKSTVSGVLIFSVVVLLLVFVSWIAVNFFKTDYEKKRDEISNKIKIEEEKFSPGEIDIHRVYDFTARVDFAVSSISTRPDQGYLFSVIESSMIPEVKAEEISYTNKNGSVETIMILKATKFIDVARQVFSFKQSNKFSGILIENIDREEKEISFKIKAIFTQSKVSKENAQ